MSVEASTSAPVPEPQEESISPWTDPPWTGWIETTGDALLILEAARRGMIPRVTRRLVDSERRMITSGSVFVFDEDESGIKRWTDGFFWSPSRILGNFLLYRETDKKANLRGTPRTSAPTSTSPSILVNDGAQPVGLRNDSSTLSRPKNTDSGEVDRVRERLLCGSLTNSKKFKPQGMMKKTFSLSIGGVAQHLISYYKVEDVEQGRLRTPSSLPELAALEISPEYLDKTHFRVPPRVEYDSDGVPRYRGEADDPESPTLGLDELTPVSPVEASSIPTSSKSKRAQRRYEPYGEGASSRARRKRPPQSHHDSHAEMTQSPPQAHSQPSSQPEDSPVTSSSSPPTSPVAPGGGGYDSSTIYYQTYNGNVSAPNGSYIPIPSGGYYAHGQSVPYASYSNTNSGSDSHPTYPSQTTFYSQPMPPHLYAPSGPGQAVPVGMMHYYPPPVTNGWRQVNTSAASAAKTGEDNNQKATPGENRQETDNANVNT